MKTYIPYSLLAAFAACGMAFGQTAYTTPVGYTTQTLAANSFNLVGFNVLKPTLSAGVLTAVSGADITDTNVDFTAVLPVGKMCVVEITSGTAAGTVQEFNSWNGSTITLPSAVAGVAVGDKYAVRVVATLQETFPVGFLAGSVIPGSADKVWVSTGPGSYAKYWYKTNAPVGWRTTTTGTNDTGAVLNDVPIVDIDGIIVQKLGVAKDLVISGEVKKTGSNVLLGSGYNLIAINPPVGLTLFTAGLQGDIAGSVIPGSADIVWVPAGGGAYNKYWYKTNAPIGWRTTTTGTNDTGAVVSDVSLTPSIFIQRKGAAKIITLDVPSTYSNL